MKKIGESRRILIGWGRKGNRLCYFLSHRTLKSPICCDPKDLQTRMKALVDLIDGGNPKRSNK